MPRLASFLLMLIVLAGFAGRAVADDRSVCFKDDSAPDAAVAACGQVLAARKTSRADRALAYLQRGLAYGRKGDYDAAFRDIDESIRLTPNAARAYHIRGLVHM